MDWQGILKTVLDRRGEYTRLQLPGRTHCSRFTTAPGPFPPEAGSTGIVSIAATVAAGTGVIVLSVNGIHSQVAALQAQAAADRRAWQASMDAFREKADADREAFRGEVHRLGERPFGHARRLRAVSARLRPLDADTPGERVAPGDAPARALAPAIRPPYPESVPHRQDRPP